MPQTTVQYVLSRLRQLGITDIFGVPGDFAFPINDAICEDKGLRFIGSCNELNAAYAADGYARVKGLAALNTTYGPGELNALGGIAGAYAEHLPIFHLVGQPSLATQRARAVVHHTLGNGEFDLFYQMTAPAVCARAIITPENCIAEAERLIAAAVPSSSGVHGLPQRCRGPANDWQYATARCTSERSRLARKCCQRDRGRRNPGEDRLHLAGDPSRPCRPAERSDCRGRCLRSAVRYDDDGQVRAR